MNRQGIERAVLLPLESPEAIFGYYLTEQALAQAAVYPERLIPFVSVDPRQVANLEESHPELAATAEKAIDLIIREPVFVG